MKAKHIARLRKKIAEKGYWAEREALYARRCKHWNHFERFDCSWAFNGYEVSERNKEYYLQNAPRDERKHEYYLNKCEEHNERLEEI